MFCKQIKIVLFFTFMPVALAAGMIGTFAQQAYSQVQVEDNESAPSIVDPDIEEIENDELRERAAEPPDRFTILENGDVRIAGVIDTLANDYFYMLNNGERIRVSLEDLGNANAVSGLLTEGEDVLVTGELMDDSELVPRIKAKKISDIDNRVRIDVTPDIDLE